ncbi:MAG: hypothetical protein HUU37_05015 [Bdellovibrionales bacterium]|nr:hypothetical protein [Bdellovibrionales bacterium]
MIEHILTLPAAALLTAGLFLSTGALLERQWARHQAHRQAVERLAREPALSLAEERVRGVTVRLRR